MWLVLVGVAVWLFVGGLVLFCACYVLGLLIVLISSFFYFCYCCVRLFDRLCGSVLCFGGLLLVFLFALLVWFLI